MARSPQNERYNCETISIKQALNLACKFGKKVQVATLIKWIDEHEPKLGHQPGGNNGTWYVFRKPFIAFISGKEALCNDLLLKITKGEIE